MNQEDPPARDALGRWQPGRSANPGGRPPDRGSSAELRRAIRAHAPAIVDRLVLAAMAGDAAAGKALLAHAVAPLKAIEEAAPVDLPGDTLSERGMAVLNAVAAGTLAPGQAQALLASLADLARLREVDELERRLSALEAAQGATP